MEILPFCNDRQIKHVGLSTGTAKSPCSGYITLTMDETGIYNADIGNTRSLPVAGCLYLNNHSGTMVSLVSSPIQRPVILFLR
jgi:hypothetical protein